MTLELCRKGEGASQEETQETMFLAGQTQMPEIQHHTQESSGRTVYGSLMEKR